MTKIKHLYTSKEDGLFEIGVIMDNKEYTYQISSEYAVRQFTNHARAGRHGKAIALLNKFKREIKEDA